MMLSLLGRPSSVASLSRTCQLSLTTAPFLISRCIHALLERCHADTLEGIEELFFGGAVLDVDIDYLGHHAGHVFGREGRAEDLTDAGITAAVAAEGDLIELLTFLVD